MPLRNATSVLGMIKRTVRFQDSRVMLSLYKTHVIVVVLGIHTI